MRQSLLNTLKIREEKMRGKRSLKSPKAPTVRSWVLYSFYSFRIEIFEFVNQNVLLCGNSSDGVGVGDVHLASFKEMRSESVFNCFDGIVEYGAITSPPGCKSTSFAFDKVSGFVESLYGKRLLNCQAPVWFRFSCGDSERVLRKLKNVVPINVNCG